MKTSTVMALVLWNLFWVLVATLVAISYMAGRVSTTVLVVGLGFAGAMGFIIPLIAPAGYRWLREQPEGSYIHLLVGVVGGLAAAYLVAVIFNLPVILAFAGGLAVCWLYWKVWRVV